MWDLSLKTKTCLSSCDQKIIICPCETSRRPKHWFKGIIKPLHCNWVKCVGECVFQIPHVSPLRYCIFVYSLACGLWSVDCSWYINQTNKFTLNRLKGTNGRQKSYEIFHVCCIFYSGFMCQTTVIFGITKDGSLVLDTLASWNYFTCRNLFQNGANDMSECLTCETAFCNKAQNFV